MPLHLYNEKKRLLKQFKEETLRQLQAMQQENPEEFFESVECCEGIIENINKIDKQMPAFSDEQKNELRELLLTVIGLRKQISPLALNLYEDLKRNMVAQKQQAIIRQKYEDEPYEIPSIFFDKKN